MTTTNRRSRPAPHDPRRPPCPDGGAASPRVLAKVRALLAKAESTPYEAEAEAFTAKAQELMTRHAISEAMLDAEGGRVGEPQRRTLDLDPPYVRAKAFLLGAVAGANRCEVVWTLEPPRAFVFGFPADLDAAELLYTSLLVQVTRAMAATGAVRDASGTSRTRSFRRSFLIGFASRVGERLREASDRTSEEVAREAGVALVPVLADRERRVRDAVTRDFPGARRHRVGVGHGGGFEAGRAAGERASLTSPSRSVPATPRLP